MLWEPGTLHNIPFPKRSALSCLVDWLVEFMTSSHIAVWWILSAVRGPGHLMVVVVPSVRPRIQALRSATFVKQNSVSLDERNFLWWRRYMYLPGFGLSGVCLESLQGPWGCCGLSEQRVSSKPWKQPCSHTNREDSLTACTLLSQPIASTRKAHPMPYCLQTWTVVAVSPAPWRKQGRNRWSFSLANHHMRLQGPVPASRMPPHK